MPKPWTPKYSVWGTGRSYRWLWVACLVTGVHAAIARWRSNFTLNK